jgi:iron complex transport system substrate-binding protein
LRARLTKSVWRWRSALLASKHASKKAHRRVGVHAFALTLACIKGLVILWFIAGGKLFAAPGPISVRDDVNHTIALEQPVKRIVTLAPSLTEIVFAAGAGKQLVAVSAYSDFPVEAKKLPQVADFSGVALEALIVQKPDLVIAWKSGNRESDLKRIRDLGIPLYTAEVAKMIDVPRVLRDIGKLAGTSAAAEQAARNFEMRAQALSDRFSARPPVRVFFEIAREPLMTISHQHAIGEIINLCGGINVFGDSALIAFAPSLEKLVSLDPDAVIYPAAAGASNSAPWSRYRLLSVWKKQRIYRIDADPILRPGPRSIEGAEQVCAALEKARATR